MPKLIVESGAAAGREFSLRADPATIGRQPDNAVFLDDHHASRHHARVSPENGHFLIEDLGSSNGTFVNGGRIEAPRRLLSGDRIVVGKTILIFDPLNASNIDLVARDEGDVPLSHMPVGDGGTLASFRVEEPRREDLTDPLTRLRVIYHYADQMRRCFDLHTLVNLTLDALFQVFEPDRGAVLLRMEREGPLEPIASRLLNPPEGDERIRISDSIVRRCLNERVSLTVLNARTDARFSDSDSIIMSGIVSAVCCPLVSGDDAFGVVYLDTIGRMREFSQHDLELATGIANQAAMALANALHHREELGRREIEMQLVMARRIHDRLLPDQGLETNRLSVFGWNRPSSSVGGDYLGIFESPRGPMLAIGDSTGHGIGAAMIMSTARAYLVGSLASSDPPLESLMGRLNSLLAADVEPGLFVTMLLLRLEEDARRMRYVAAGHEPPLLYRNSTDEFISLPPGGVALGLAGDFAFSETASVDLQPGDRICLFTDGIVEQQDSSGEEFGIPRLREAVRKSVDLPPKRACSEIASHVDKWRAALDQADDLTLMITQVK
ncbi:SpoIIE family protein phosphatase [bacterium]|nr:SpoIIE family protein phosphatase [bacterium]